MKKILIIQTAFIGDVILATSLVETLAKAEPDAKLDMLVRKGNEVLLANNPLLNKVLIWDKQASKYGHLKKLAREIRSTKYEVVINLQRFASTGYLTWKSRAERKIGFKKNPLSFFFTEKYVHDLEHKKHEIERNAILLSSWNISQIERPKLYPGEAAIQKINEITGGEKYVVMAPSSVWFTKALPVNKWNELIESIPAELKVFLIGAPGDFDLLEKIKEEHPQRQIENTAGRLTLLESTELISRARMNYVNDSAPLHMASATNAPVTVFFCSTIPDFGFGPLSDISYIRQVEEDLPCRPCGLHGKKECPKGHFDCGYKIDVVGKR